MIMEQRGSTAHGTANLQEPPGQLAPKVSDCSLCRSIRDLVCASESCQTLVWASNDCSGHGPHDQPCRCPGGNNGSPPRHGYHRQSSGPRKILIPRNFGRGGAPLSLLRSQCVLSRILKQETMARLSAGILYHTLAPVRDAQLLEGRVPARPSGTRGRRAAVRCVMIRPQQIY